MATTVAINTYVCNSRIVKKVATGANMVSIAVTEYFRDNGLESSNRLHRYDTCSGSGRKQQAVAATGFNTRLTLNGGDRVDKVVVQYARIHGPVTSCRAPVQRFLEYTPRSLVIVD